MAISIVVLVKLERSLASEEGDHIRKSLVENLDLDEHSDFYYEGVFIKMESNDYEIIDQIGLDNLYNVNINRSFKSSTYGGNESLLNKCVLILRTLISDCEIWYGGDGGMIDFVKVEE